MKLASLKSGRDGSFVVVSADLSRAAFATGVAPTLQCALDDWVRVAPMLGALAMQVENGAVETFAFDARDCAAPLPRAYQWADGSAYVNHVALVRKARGADMPPSFWTDPLLYQGGSDTFSGACDPIRGLATKVSVSTSKRRSLSSPTTFPWASMRATRDRISNCSCWSTTCRCAD